MPLDFSIKINFPGEFWAIVTKQKPCMGSCFNAAAAIWAKPFEVQPPNQSSIAHKMSVKSERLLLQEPITNNNGFRGIHKKQSIWNRCVCVCVLCLQSNGKTFSSVNLLYSFSSSRFITLLHFCRCLFFLLLNAIRTNEREHSHLNHANNDARF